MEAHMPKSITIDEYEEYEIEEILDRKNAKGELWYKMKWLRWSQKYNQWITYEDLKSALKMWNVYDE